MYSIKKYTALFLSALLLLSLCACGAPSQKEGMTQTPPPAVPSAPSPSDETLLSSAEALTLVTSEEEVRGLYAPDYEADPTNPPILSITEYEGDYLVRLGSEHDTQWLDWVYGQSGIRRRMLFVDAELLDLEIESPACIRTVVGGPNIYNGVPGIPRVERVALNLLYDELGQALDYDVYSSGSKELTPC